MPNFADINSCCLKIPEDSRHFPADAMQLLYEESLLQINLPKRFREKAERIPVYETLCKIGKCNLSVGRIYEGHLNAINLIKDHGSESQKEYFFQQAKIGKLFSVWNTEMSSEALTAQSSPGKLKMNGAKTFCSGGLQIDHAIITAEVDGDKQMLILPLKEYPKLIEDWSLWNPMGMKNSVSCRIDFLGLEVSSDLKLGKLNAYQQQPWFSGGAMRFAAVQLGGAEALMHSAIDHLNAQNKSNDPYQQQRMGTMAILVESGKFWLQKAQEIDDNQKNYTSAEIVNFADMMRSAILNISEEILQLTERSIGVQGFMENHPMEQVYRDLKVYLKQPGPDLALKNVGAYTFEHYKK
jgi:alkylation response protein AidB-like acyl-CoA dehydrogenase